jgi:membrane-anchored protein YejM (alkaline phosphatase superfamily)
MNLVETHEPYFWNETPLHAVFASVIGNDAYMAEWLKKYPVDRRYPVHSSVAVSRLVNGIMALSKYFSNSVIIVTSDHGQLIGENFRYGHGYLLNDELLRVPLYVKYPFYVKYPCGVRHTDSICLTKFQNGLFTLFYIL